MRCSFLIAMFILAIGAHEQPTGGASKRGVARAPFGKTGDGRAVEIYTLTNAHGVEMRVITYGGTSCR